jgi:hypothetical protein
LKSDPYERSTPTAETELATLMLTASFWTGLASAVTVKPVTTARTTTERTTNAFIVLPSLFLSLLPYKNYNT